jgi:hypothetical protein
MVAVAGRDWRGVEGGYGFGRRGVLGGWFTPRGNIFEAYRYRLSFRAGSTTGDGEFLITCDEDVGNLSSSSIALTD